MDLWKSRFWKRQKQRHYHLLIWACLPKSRYQSQHGSCGEKQDQSNPFVGFCGYHAFNLQLRPCVVMVTAAGGEGKKKGSIAFELTGMHGYNESHHYVRNRQCRLRLELLLFALKQGLLRARSAATVNPPVPIWKHRRTWGCVANAECAEIWPHACKAIKLNFRITHVTRVIILYFLVFF